MSRALAEIAPAKVNLTLAVLGRRADGYHTLRSLVAFAGLHDTLRLKPVDGLSLSVRGPQAAAIGPLRKNLVLKAAANLSRRIPGLTLGHFVLFKRLPAAAGLGGGSADAAAALRLLARANRISMDDPRLMAAARDTGADVPVCLDPRPRTMEGIGDRLSPPLALPRLPAVLINPGVALPTADVFARLDRRGARRRPGSQRSKAPPRELELLLAYLAARPNDLDAPAIDLAPPVARALSALGNSPGCLLARMTGSGATCFGLFRSARAAGAAARRLGALHPRWWVKATWIGGQGRSLR